MTSVQASRATGSSPTLNVIQLPSPTAGSASPVEGIGRVRIARGGICANEGRSAADRPVAANARNAWRRFYISRVTGGLWRGCYFDVSGGNTFADRAPLFRARSSADRGSADPAGQVPP